MRFNDKHYFVLQRLDTAGAQSVLQMESTSIRRNLTPITRYLQSCGMIAVVDAKTRLFKITDKGQEQLAKKRALETLTTIVSQQEPLSSPIRQALKDHLVELYEPNTNQPEADPLQELLTAVRAALPYVSSPSHIATLQQKLNAFNL